MVTSHEGLTVLEAAVDMLHHTRDLGKWKEGDRFWVQVRAFWQGEAVLRFFNMETGETYDRNYTIRQEPPR